MMSEVPVKHDERPEQLPPQIDMDIPQEVFVVFLNQLSRELISSQVFALALLSTRKMLVGIGVDEA